MRKASWTIDGRKVIFASHEWTIFRVLFNARGAAVHLVDIENAMYEGVEHPAWGRKGIRVVLTILRMKLAPTRFRIRNRWGGFYYMERAPVSVFAATRQALLSHGA